MARSSFFFFHGGVFDRETIALNLNRMQMWHLGGALTFYGGGWRALILNI
jgi:hypothetical protein